MSIMEEIIVRTESPYAIRFCNNACSELLHAVFAQLGETQKVSQLIFIVDEILADVVAPITSSFASSHLIFLPGDETAVKTPSMKSELDQNILSLSPRVDRNSVLVSIGGGSIGDLVGFVASTLLRGMRFVQVPTTVLAIADSSVGGKTGVNVPSVGKNLIGSFYQPSGVVIDTKFLETLPPRHWSNGMAEIVKAGVADEKNKVWPLLESWDAKKKFSPDLVLPLLIAAVKYKARIVETDPFERSVRAELNLGHTIGHAIEFDRDLGLLHGECVSIGIVHEMLALRRIGHLECPGDIPRVETMLKKFNLPTEVPAGIELTKFTEYILRDKKNSSTDVCSVSVVGLKRIGRCEGRHSSSRTVSIPLNVILSVVSPYIQPHPSLSTHPVRVTLPGSKSIANRALLMATLSDNPCVLYNVPADGEDVCIMRAALVELGVSLAEQSDGGLVVSKENSFFKRKDSVMEYNIFVGNSGTSLRFLIPALAVALLDCPIGTTVTITCAPRMSERPNADLIRAVAELVDSVEIIYLQNPFCVPLILKRGSARPFSSIPSISVSGAVSSQFVSGLLMAAPVYCSDLEILVGGDSLVSKEYVDMTVSLMRVFGVADVHTAEMSYTVSSSGYRGCTSYCVPGDASSASYPLAIGALTGRRVAVNVGPDCLQSEYAFVSMLRDVCGGELDVDEPGWTTYVPGEKSDAKNISLAMNECTDSFLTMAAALAVTGRSGRITSIANQRVKECDRIFAMAYNLSHLGCLIEETEDGLFFSGTPEDAVPRTLPILRTWNDHRVAMAMAVACIGGRHSGKIENPRCVEKTFPGFWDMLANQFGFAITGEDAARPDDLPTVLIGMRGIGKSTLARSVETEFDVIDLDVEIEKLTKMKIAEYIDSVGWEMFRVTENVMLQRSLIRAARRSDKRALIACGGGIVENVNSRKMLKDLKNVIWVRSACDEETVRLARGEGGNAPQYDASVLEVYTRRKPFFRECSNFEFFINRGDSGERFAEFLRARPLPEFGEQSTFVCLTAASYTGWTLGDLRAACGGPHRSVEAAEIRVDLVEDFDEFFARFEDLRALARMVGLVVILTYRTRDEGGQGSVEKYEYVIKSLLRLRPDWIDIECSRHVEGLIRGRVHTTRFIASRHFLTPVDDSTLSSNMDEILSTRWSAVGKIVMRADSQCDSIRMIAQREDSMTKPLITVCTGKAGVLSRVLNPVWTPVRSLTMLAAAPGQLGPFELQTLRHPPNHSKPLYHLFGSPIAHSPSPFIHNLMFAMRDIPGEYCRTPIEGGLTREFFEHVHHPDFRGASVTIPLKEKVFEWMNSLDAATIDPIAFRAKSINSIVKRANGQFEGYNTDIDALEKVLKRFPSQSVLVVGTGGAARGALVAAQRGSGGRISVLGRNEVVMSELTSEFNLVPFDQENEYSVIVSCVPSHAQIEFLTKFPRLIQPTTTLVEMAYIPRITPFAEKATSVVFGEEILLLQAVRQHELWTSAEGSVDLEFLAQQLKRYRENSL
jgi:pentafunctional AROM polypeptide